MQPGSTSTPAVIALILAIVGTLILLKMDWILDKPFGMVA